ncbi:DUF1804 family protein [Otariodibacter oris]|uniref:Uncharacterized protein DUF1804 n=1 Tax=Otariodibacter oris TaxID=1032623 RepID=A0A420XII4_9PAST|nr:DUF1804 family protein [Otariodibacter oris]QGM80672.1 DNA-binding protein [Otariodibacter oris]RKR77167.1 uncharacterized protein DUF1804 [Otariodibacter oris]
MAHDPQVRVELRRYYVFDRFSLEQSAQKAGVSFGTARRWKNEALKAGDDWDKARDVQVMVGGDVEALATGLLSGFVVQYKTVMDELEKSDIAPSTKIELLTGLADSFAKMTASSKKLIPSVSEMATALKVVEMFANKVKQQKPALLPDFMQIMSELESDFGKAFKDR